MKKPKKAVNKVLDIISTVIIVLLLLCVIANFQTTLLGKKYNSLFGYSFFEVETGSMAGTLEIGDWIIVKVTQDVDVDDVVTFEQDGAIITHRVIETYGDNLVTKGDSNNVKDNPITRENVVGKVIKVLPKFSIVKKTILNEKVLILLFALIFTFNSIFNKELLDQIKAKIMKEKPKKEVKIEPSEEEKKVIDTIADVPASSKTTLLSKVDVDFGNNKMMSKVKDAYKEEETPKEEYKNPEDEFGININEETFAKVKEKIDAKNEVVEEYEEYVDEGNAEDLDISMNVRRSKKDIINQFIEEADAMEGARTDAFDTDLNLITKRLGIDEKIEIGKDEKSIIKKYLALKKAEVKRLYFAILPESENEDEYKTVVNKFVDVYMDALYYKGGTPEVMKNPLLNVSKILASYNNELLKDIKNNNNKKQVIHKVYLIANAVLQIELSKFDEDTIHKIFTSPRFEFEDAAKSEKLFVKEYKKFIEAYKLFSKRIETKKMVLDLERVPDTDLYFSHLKTNIKISKIFSDYIIDKTYGETIINENLKEVEIIMLTSELTDDIRTFNNKKKYLLYLPETLYSKSKKIISLLKLIDDEYSQSKVFILITENILKNNLNTLGNLKKLGYNIYLEVPSDRLQHIPDKKLDLYISNIIVVDENKKVDLSKINIESLDKDEFIINESTCIKGVEYK